MPVPTATQLACVFADLKKGRACGPDVIPAELLSAVPVEAAALFQFIFQRLVEERAEPRSWCGGTLVPIPQSRGGKRLDVKAVRPGVVADASAKAWHLWVRCMLLQKVEAFTSDSQHGGLAGEGMDFAAHSLRQFFMLALQKKLSAAVLFVNLAAAFDSLIREVVMGAQMENGKLRCNLIAIGLGPHVAEGVLWCVSKGDVLQMGPGGDGRVAAHHSR